MKKKAFAPVPCIDSEKFMTDPDPERVPGSCWNCGFFVEDSNLFGYASEDTDKKEPKCPRCGVCFTLTNTPDDLMLPDRIAQSNTIEEAAKHIIINKSGPYEISELLGVDESVAETLYYFSKDVGKLGQPFRWFVNLIKDLTKKKVDTEEWVKMTSKKTAQSSNEFKELGLEDNQIDELINLIDKNDVNGALDFANRAMRQFGVETIKDHNGDVVAEYINTGDTYNTTLLYDHTLDQFEVTTWGDWLEKFERDELTNYISDNIPSSVKGEDVAKYLWDNHQVTNMSEFEEKWLDEAIKHFTGEDEEDEFVPDEEELTDLITLEVMDSIESKLGISRDDIVQVGDNLWEVNAPVEKVLWATDAVSESTWFEGEESFTVSDYININVRALGPDKSTVELKWVPNE